MNAEIRAVGEFGTNDVRQGADTHLQAGPVFHHLGNDLGNGVIGVVRLTDRQFKQRKIILDDRRDLGDVNLSPGSGDSRHLVIDLHDQLLGCASDAAGVVIPGPQRKVSVPIHRRNRGQERVDPDIVAQQSRCFVEVARQVRNDLTAAIVLGLFDQRALNA
jgi:hypothetical protein